jgi:hypothetical protein
MVASALVHRRIAHAPQIMKQRAPRDTNRATIRQPSDQLLVPLLRCHIQPHLSGRALRQHLPKLPQLEQRDRRIRRKVLLRLRRQRDQPRMVIREIGEVSGRSDSQDSGGPQKANN